MVVDDRVLSRYLQENEMRVPLSLGDTIYIQDMKTGAIVPRLHVTCALHYNGFRAGFEGEEINPALHKNEEFDKGYTLGYLARESPDKLRSVERFKRRIEPEQAPRPGSNSWLPPLRLVKSE